VNAQLSLPPLANPLTRAVKAAIYFIFYEE